MALDSVNTMEVGAIARSHRQAPSRLRTLGIASFASAIAAVITSELWEAGVLVTAAVTPVIVALVSDALNGLGGVEASRGELERGRRRFPLLAAFVTGLLGFAIAVVVLTIPESLLGHPVIGEGDTTFGDIPVVDQLRAWIEDLRVWVETLVAEAESA